ncbi:hypothetical protein COO91_04238 [Nostoc flagelliforme CCNUN1]|uniref:Uncharacterized protein n=1 Tax=Nostoc flagelliforme CCNUN1 TaxID=2038116 RepID=A0A2K8SSH6_9NOSO|nr:hypothetical protein COO91_04238 [Nostoc flagelliforme CCNUN1]
MLDGINQYITVWALTFPNSKKYVSFLFVQNLNQSVISNSQMPT